ncbi:unnamed protein product [Calicophoron daubneyi]|uniref:Galactokinase n=1 Tax=Calicophoron daubneyi TaxID=300641 RepID=A0AAV2TTG3_CALDB
MSAGDDDDCVPAYPLDEGAMRLSDLMKQATGVACDFVVRAPGRVNLIGEHIDYNGYAVLPMALEQCVMMGVSVQKGDSVVLTSTDPQYEKAVVSIADALEFGSNGPPSAPSWYHYFLCAYHGMADYAASKKMAWTPPSLIVHVGDAEIGGLWPAAGLSSSSAMVVASAIAIMRASGLQIRPRELAVLCADCERYIGTQSGGMDQAASLLGHANYAILIEFTRPMVTVHPVRLPSDAVFVVAHSGVNSRKAATSMYNERVSECRLAAKVLSLEAPTTVSTQVGRPMVLCDAQRAWNIPKPGGMVEQKPGAPSIVTKYLKSGVTTRENLLSGLLNKDEIDHCLAPTVKTMDNFRLRDRAEHVYSEAERVWEFYELCQSRSPAAGDTDGSLLLRLGELMDASQKSCRDLYNCSCPELDELVRVCKSAGALGSRLTGAGWGGCTVSLVPKSILPEFLKKVRENFYIKRGLEKSADKMLYVSRPGRPGGYMVVREQS